MSSEQPKDRSPELWQELLKQLRKQNPTQKFKLEKAYYDSRRDVNVDGIPVEVALDTERLGDGWRSRPGRHYFTVGCWHRARPRKRAIEGKTGFDWARVAQLVEHERLRIVAEQEHEAEAVRAEGVAEKQLAELLKRRRDLRNISNRLTEIVGGKFNVEIRGVSIEVLERVLDAAKLAQDDADYE